MKPTLADVRGKIANRHLERAAYVYVRQSSPEQVRTNVESTRRQYDMAERAVAMGYCREQVKVIDDDQGKSGATLSPSCESRPLPAVSGAAQLRGANVRLLRCVNVTLAFRRSHCAGR